VGLDTLFIDEGFSSFAPANVESAITTLIALQKAGRMAEII
jgi:DNA repair exonuclease SbcCD ATPase subunit